MTNPVNPRFVSILVSFLILLVATTTASAQSCTKFGGQEFFKLATVELVNACLADGASVTQRSENGETPLHWAAGFANDAAIVEVLIASGASFELKNKNGKLPIHFAAEFGAQPAIITSLVFAGADVNALFDEFDPWGPRSGGTSALIVASGRGDGAGLVSVLLASGADIDTYNEKGRTALHEAALDATSSKIIKLLLNADASVKRKDSEKWTPLHLAAATARSPDVVKALIAASADVDKKGSERITPLIYAARFTESMEIFDLLVSATSDPCASDSKGRTALAIAENNASIKGTEPYWKLVQLCRN